MRKKLILGLALIFVLSGCAAIEGDLGQGEMLTPEEAKEEARGFINEELIAEGQAGAEISEITEEKGLYKLYVQLQGQIIESYMTLDGKKFFPQGIDMEDPDQQLQQDEAAQQQPQEMMSQEEQVDMMIDESRMMLDQMGDDMDSGDRSRFEQAVEELETLSESEDPDQDEMSQKIMELQESVQPIIEDMMGDQQLDVGEVGPEDIEGGAEIDISPQQ